MSVLRQDFRDAFPGETDDDLSAIRQKFLGQAFERRQELLLQYLMARGYGPDWIARASLSELIGLELDQEGIAVRSGHHCAHPLMQFYGVPATLRASLSFYNTRDEVDQFVAAVERVRKLLA